MRQLLLGVATAVFVLSTIGGCATARDSVGSGDSRLDEPARVEGATKNAADDRCGPDGKGDLVLLDARTGGVVPCLSVTILREAMGCSPDLDCPSDVVFRGATNRQGQVLLNGPVERARLVVVAEGFGPSSLPNATTTAGQVMELELNPSEGFWLKVLDGEGNYLVDLSLVFKQGDAVLAQLRTNPLANAFFMLRVPFAGQPVLVESPGFKSRTITGVTELGSDGHTLVLNR